MSVKPKIVCPPDYSILSLRFTECKKLGVVKGAKTLLSVDLSPFYIPVTNYSLRQFKVLAGKTMKLDIDDIASYWPLQEKYSFKALNAAVVDGTSHTFSLFDEYGASLATVSFTVDVNDPDYENFLTALKTAVGLNVVMSSYISVAPQISPDAGFENSSFVATAIAKGTKYTYLMVYDITNWGNVGPYEHPGTLTQKDYKYPKGAVRGFYIYADFARADASTCTCGCLDASGELLSNVKNYKWAWDSEYTKKQYKADETGVLVNADAGDPSQISGTGQRFQWLTSGNAAAYHLEVGDLITLDSSTFNPYAYISEVDGYNIYVDRAGFGSGLLNEEILQRYAPAPIQWKVGGELLFLSGGQDVYEEDRLYIETIWINNPQNYDIPFTAIIVS